MSAIRSRLESVMMEFLERRLGGECIDKLTRTPAQDREKRADFFLNDRSAVVEVKAITDDRESAVRSVIERRRGEPGWPNVPQESALQDALRGHPQAREINEEIYRAATASIEGLVKKANKQIRTTKRAFELEGAGGILMLLNERSDMLDPKVLAVKISQLLGKKAPGGARRFPDVDIVFLVIWAHQVVTDGHPQGDIIMAATPADHAEAKTLVEVQEFIMREWAAFRNLPLKEGGLLTNFEDVRKIEFRGRKDPPVF